MNDKQGSKGGFLKKLALAVAVSAASGAAMATAPAVDVSAATEGLTAVSTAVNSIGPLMLAAVAAGIVYKWVTAFLI